MKKWNETWQNINDGFSEIEIHFSKMYIFFMHIQKKYFLMKINIECQLLMIRVVKYQFQYKKACFNSILICLEFRV